MVTRGLGQRHPSRATWTVVWHPLASVIRINVSPPDRRAKVKKITWLRRRCSGNTAIVPSETSTEIQPRAPVTVTVCLAKSRVRIDVGIDSIASSPHAPACSVSSTMTATRSVASPVPGPHAGSRRRRFVLRDLPGSRDRAARAALGLRLETLRARAGRSLEIAARSMPA